MNNVYMREEAHKQGIAGLMLVAAEDDTNGEVFDFESDHED